MDDNYDVQDWGDGSDHEVDQTLWPCNACGECLLRFLQTKDFAPVWL